MAVRQVYLPSFIHLIILNFSHHSDALSPLLPTLSPSSTALIVPRSTVLPIFHSVIPSTAPPPYQPGASILISTPIPSYQPYTLDQQPQRRTRNPSPGTSGKPYARNHTNVDSKLNSKLFGLSIPTSPSFRHFPGILHIRSSWIQIDKAILDREVVVSGTIVPFGSGIYLYAERQRWSGERGIVLPNPCFTYR